MSKTTIMLELLATFGGIGMVESSLIALWFACDSSACSTPALNRPADRITARIHA